MLRRAFLFILFVLHSAFANAENDSSSAVKRSFPLILPVVYRTPETSWAFGGAAAFTFRTCKNDSVRTSNINLLGVVSLKSQILAGADVSTYFPDESYILRTHLAYFKYSDKFWGIGNDTPDGNEENFQYQQIHVFPQLLKKVYKKFYFGVCLDFQRVFDFSLKSGSLIHKDYTEGAQTATIPGVGVILTYDSRNHAFCPTKGGFFEVIRTDFDRYTGSHYDFKNMKIDARKYIRLWHSRKFNLRSHILGLQFYANLNSGNPPLLSLATVGGANMMRGYFNGRFRDKNLVSGQSEYRMPLTKRFGMVAFVAAGQVLDRLKKFDLGKMKFTYGGGLRYALKKKEKLNLRLDYGFGYKTRGCYLTISEAF